ncbi:MAG: ribonuclease H-like domain-containing protein [Chitinophagales bacterium]|nr:ribonuclease H-like domain-containing protein [Chitinophagales bacterium]
MFAIVDIETTGGNNITERIIEIAIIIHNGEKVIEEYTTLINPNKKINAFISTFTGITNSMVANAPSFEEVADTINQLTHNKIFVAHNAKFDYHFIKNEFKRLNTPFQRQTLDTVQLSRKAFPKQKSYSLGKLCSALEIPIDNRHRAFGDARATAILFEKIILHHNEDFFKHTIKKPTLFLPDTIDVHFIESLPEETGLYLFRDKENNILHIDKTKNIKDSIYYFYKEKPKERYKKELFELTHSIEIELTGNELLAILLKKHYVQQHQPKYNKQQFTSDFSFGIFAENDAAGFKKLMVKVIDEAETPIIKFTSKLKAEKMMQHILSNFKTMPSFKKIDSSFIYNKKLDDILSKFTYPNENFILIDEGRNFDEKCAFLIKDNTLIGYCFYQPEFINDFSLLEEQIIPIEENAETAKNIIQYIRKNKNKLDIIAF